MDFSNVVVIDCESTGLDISKDRITQIGMCRGSREYNQLVNPGVPIPIEVQKLTRVTDEMVKDAPAFKDIADDVVAFLGGYDWAGFNLSGFDLPLLAEELGREGKLLKWQGRAIIDAAVIFKKKEARTLTAAMKFYCNQDHAEAHSALADAKATRYVLEAQVLRYTDLTEMAPQQLSEASQYEPRVDLAGKLTLNSKGEIVYNFGKSKGMEISKDEGFGRWMLSKDFPIDTKAIVSKVLSGKSEAQMTF
jgi:DNA polymerase III subunit epsilon